MIRKPYRHQRSRSHITPPNLPVFPGLATTFSIVANKARLVFSAPVVISGLPVGITRQAAGAGPQLLPTSFTVVDAQTVDLGYAANVVATDILTVPANVPQIRAQAGGAVAAATHTF